jgi:hypothetical protein
MMTPKSSIFDIFIRILSIKRNQMISTSRSQEEWQFVKIHVRRNVSDFTSVDGNLVSQHTWSWNFDRICPIVVIVT